MISLQNEGLLELEFIRTMGVNVKDNDNCIGFFGTGLKYAIAVFLRENIPFNLYIGNNKFEFYTENKTIRGKDFNLCYMRGPFDVTELGFTTDLGKNWSLWQAYREIHSNCLDEPKTLIVENRLSPEKGKTTFIFKDINEKLDIDSIFLNWKNKKELIYEDENIEVYDGEADCIFYKGIRAKQLYQNSIYTYNLKKECTLTEDRLICYDSDVKHIINNAVLKLSENYPEVVEKIITSNYDNFEGDLNMHYNTTEKPTESFREAVNRIKDLDKPVNYGVQEYIKKHEPAKILTREEEKEEFIEYLESLCEDYKVTLDRDDTCTTSFVLYGGILNNED